MALDGYGPNSSLLTLLRLHPWQGSDLVSAHPSSAAPLVPHQGQGQQGTLPQAQARACSSNALPLGPAQLRATRSQQGHHPWATRT